MASQPSDTDLLDLQLFRDDDDEEDLAYKKRLHALVVGDVTPLEAATDFDAWIVDEANARLKKLLKRADPTNLTPEEEEQGVSLRSISPNASDYIEMAFRSIAHLLSAHPPNHLGQERIVQFMEALRSMPEHQVLDGILTRDLDNHDHMITLWPFGGTWQALDMYFDREAYRALFQF
jgi:hypothetical protein